MTLQPAALQRLRGDAEKVLAELEEMKEEAAHTPTRVNLHHFFQRSGYKEPLLIVLAINLGSQLSGFSAVSPRPSSGRLISATLPKRGCVCRSSTIPPGCLRLGLLKPRT